MIFCQIGGQASVSAFLGVSVLKELFFKFNLNHYIK